MKKIVFSREEKTVLVKRVRDYLETELDLNIGVIPTEMLLDFLQTDIGAYYYNRGLRDAQAAFHKQVDSFDDAIYGLEQREAALR